MAELGYQNPASSDSKLESTLANPGGTSDGIEVRRENVQVVVSHDRREMEELQFLSSIDRNQAFNARRHYERLSLVDRRGNVGRGSTR